MDNQIKLEYGEEMAMRGAGGGGGSNNGCRVRIVRKCLYTVEVGSDMGSRMRGGWVATICVARHRLLRTQLAILN